MNSVNCESTDLMRALDRVIICHRDKWLGFVRSMLKNHTDAEDIIQDAVLRVMKSSRRFESEEQVRKYLGRTVCNIAIDHYHKLRRKPGRTFPFHEQALMVASGETPESVLLAKEEAENKERLLNLVDEGLGHLPYKQYEALRLTILDPGLVSIREAGIGNDIPYSTLRHRSRQGLRGLRRFIRRAARVG